MYACAKIHIKTNVDVDHVTFQCHNIIIALRLCFEKSQQLTIGTYFDCLFSYIYKFLIILQFCVDSLEFTLDLFHRNRNVAQLVDLTHWSWIIE